MKGNRTIVTLLVMTGLMVTQSTLAAFTIDRHTETLNWDSAVGETNRIMRCDDLVGNQWTNASGDLVASSTDSSWPITVVDKGYYRLQLKTGTNPDIYQDVEGIVGYSKQTLVPGYNMVANPFVGTNEAMTTITETFATLLPDGTELLVHYGSGFDMYTYFADWGWFDDVFGQPPFYIDRGDGLWLKNNSGSTIEFLFAGNVPASGSTTNVLRPGYNIVANPYPTEMELYLIPGENIGDELLKWTGDAYHIYTWYGYWDDDFLGGPPPPLSVGEAVWFRSIGGTDRDWVVEKPY